MAQESRYFGERAKDIQQARVGYEALLKHLDVAVGKSMEAKLQSAFGEVFQGTAHQHVNNQRRIVQLLMSNAALHKGLLQDIFSREFEAGVESRIAS